MNQKSLVPRTLALVALGIAAAVAASAPPAFAAATPDPPAEADGPDLTAELLGLEVSGRSRTPVVECEGGGRQRLCALRVRFHNQGDQPTDPSSLAFAMYEGKKLGGYAQTFGGSGGRRQLPGLAPGQSIELTFAARGVAAGVYSLKLQYSPGISEMDDEVQTDDRYKNQNHQIEQTLEFAYSN